MVGKYTIHSSIRWGQFLFCPRLDRWPSNRHHGVGTSRSQYQPKVTICTESTHANFVQKHSAPWPALGVDHRIRGPGKWTAVERTSENDQHLQTSFWTKPSLVFHVNFQECIYGYVWCCIVMLICPNSFGALVWIGWFYHIPLTFYIPYTHSIHVWYISVRFP